MATTRRKATEPEYIPLDDAERMAQLAAGRALAAMPEPPEPEVEQDPDDIALQNVLSELGTSGADAKVNIYQLDQRQNRAFIGAFLPSEFSLERVQSDFGPGDYEIRVYTQGRLATRKVIKIATPKNATPVAGNNAMQGADTSKIIETMQDGFKEMGGMFAAALSALAQNQPKPKTTLETLQELQMMREILGGNKPVENNQPDPMRLFEMATQIAEKIQPRTGEPGTGEIILEAIKNFAPMLSNAQAMQMTARAPIQNPAVLVNPLPQQVENTAFQQTQNISEDQTDMNLMRKMYLNLLIKNAEADNDPSTYASLMLDLAGESAAIEFASDPQWFAKLCDEEPRAVNYHAWFDELRSNVIELTKPELPDTTVAIEQPTIPPCDVPK